MKKSEEKKMLQRRGGNPCKKFKALKFNGRKDNKNFFKRQYC